MRFKNPMKRRSLLLLALLALAAPQLIPQSSQQVAAAAQAGGFGTIQGTIVLEGTTEPLSDVQLALTGGSGMTAQEAQLLLNAVGRGVTFPTEILQNAQDAVKDGASAALAVSDRAGQFTFRNVRAGTQSLRAQLEGYFGPFANGGYPPIATLPVTVTADQTSTVRLSLIPGGTISGRVIDPSGKPLSDGTVRLLRSAYEGCLFLPNRTRHNVVLSVSDQGTDHNGQET